MVASHFQFTLADLATLPSPAMTRSVNRMKTILTPKYVGFVQGNLKSQRRGAQMRNQRPRKQDDLNGKRGL